MSNGKWSTIAPAVNVVPAGLRAVTVMMLWPGAGRGPGFWAGAVDKVDKVDQADKVDKVDGVGRERDSPLQGAFRRRRCGERGRRKREQGTGNRERGQPPSGGFPAAGVAAGDGTVVYGGGGDAMKLSSGSPPRTTNPPVNWWAAPQPSLRDLSMGWLTHAARGAVLLVVCCCLFLVLCSFLPVLRWLRAVESGEEGRGNKEQGARSAPFRGLSGGGVAAGDGTVVYGGGGGGA